MLRFLRKVPRDRKGRAFFSAFLYLRPGILLFDVLFLLGLDFNSSRLRLLQIWITPAFPSIPVLPVLPHLFCGAHTGAEGRFRCLLAPVCCFDCNIIVLVFITEDLTGLSADKLFCMVKQLGRRFGAIFLKVE